MMTTHARAFAFSGIFLASFGSTACYEVQGNGHVETQSRDATGFTQIENHSSLPVSVVQGAAFSINVRVDSNLQPLVETTVEAGVLRIDERESFDADGRSLVSIVLPSLDQVTHDGSGAMTVSGIAAEETVHLVCGGSGGLRFDGTVGALSADVSGSGDVWLNGSAMHLSADVRGSGSLDASRLAADGADLVTLGSGSLAATVTGDATLSTEGSGSIDAVLNGGTATFSVSGSGSILWSGDERVAIVLQTGSGRVRHD
jgi:hypothetical protein